jgi:hypothetical protein
LENKQTGNESVQQEIKRMEEEQYNSFLPKAIKIQEALRPLGYAVNGLFEKPTGGLEVHLFSVGSFICINELDVVNSDILGSTTLDKPQNSNEVFV